MKVIGIGVSAGGLEALIEFLSNVPVTLKNSAFIIAQHLSPNYKSLLVQLLSKDCKINVIEARDNQIIESATVYITPPDFDIHVDNKRIWLTKPPVGHYPKPSVDLMLSSIAKEYKEDAVAIILSGTGSDGSKGIVDIKSNGGLTFAQLPSEAKFDGMPQAAINSNAIDYVVKVAEMGEIINAYLDNKHVEINFNNNTIEEEIRLIALKSASKQIFEILSNKYGTNFSNYKQSTILRRFNKRLVDLQISTLDKYVIYLQNNVVEVEILYNTLLIGVTSFFRDLDAFIELGKIIEKMVEEKRDADKIRIWVPGCCTGEEAYSIALLVHKIIFEKEKSNISVQIFATDIDESSISFARKGIYDLISVDKLDDFWLNNFFTKKEDTYELSKNIRSMVLFSRQDITTNPPFLKLDLISCRNLLIYFKSELQEHIFPIFHYSLNPNGILFLGRSETVGSMSKLFETVNAKLKIFKRKVVNQRLAPIKLNLLRPIKITDDENSIEKHETNQTFSQRLKEALYGAFEHTFVVINSSMDVILVQGKVNDFVSIPQGTVTTNLYKMLNSDIQIEVRTIISKVIRDKNNATTTLKKIKINGEILFYRVLVKYLPKLNSLEEHFLVVFETFDIDEEIKRFTGTTEDSPAEKQRIFELENELNVTKEHLQTYIEEIETANEELQTLNEELQSSNEELQSSNEELETGNEELQFSNEELQIAYSELKYANENLLIKDTKIEELNLQFLSVLNNTILGYVLIARNYTISYYNQRVIDILGKLNDLKVEIGKSIFDFFDTTIFENIPKDIKRSFEGVNEIHKYCFKDKNGANIWLEFSYSSIKEVNKEIEFIAIGIQDITATENLLEEITQKTAYLNSLLDSNSTYLIRLDLQARFTYVNNTFCQKFNCLKDEIIGKDFNQTVLVDDLYIYEEASRYAFNNPSNVVRFEVRSPNPEGDYFLTDWEFITIQNSAGQIYELQCVGRDVSEKLQKENRFLEAVNRFNSFMENAPFAVYITDISNRIILSNKFLQDILPHKLNDHLKDISTPVIYQRIFEENKSIISTNNAISYHEEYFVNGDLRCYFTTKFPIKNATGENHAVGGISIDVTESNKSKNQLALSEARNRSLLESTTFFLIRLDLEGRYTYSNKSFLNKFGKKMEDLKFIYFKDKVTDDDKEKFLTCFENCIENQGIVNKVNLKRLNHFNQEVNTFWEFVSITNNLNEVIEIQAVGWDTTELVAQGRENKKLAMIAELTKNGVIISDLKGRIEWVNRGFELITGYDFEEVVGKKPGSFLQGPETSLEMAEYMSQKIINLESFTLEILNYKKDGSKYWVNIEAQPLLDENNNFYKYMAIETDITEKKESQLFEKNLIEDLLLKNKNLEEFSYILSHNLRSPVANILGLVNIYKFDNPTELNEKIIESVLKSANHLDSVIKDVNQIISYRKNINEQEEPINLNELINYVVDSFEVERKSIESNIEIIIESTVIVKSIKAYVESILFNLVSNAIKYRKKDFLLQIIISVEIIDDMVLIKVHDNGIGFDLKLFRDKIFKLYSRFNTEEQGKGMGLFMSKQQAELIGGKLSVESYLNIGTTFTLTLPINQ
jgi:two-component system, chemotaxis family, CheB/CheR fusion protein